MVARRRVLVALVAVALLGLSAGATSTRGPEREPAAALGAETLVQTNRSPAASTLVKRDFGDSLTLAAIAVLATLVGLGVRGRGVLPAGRDRFTLAPARRRGVRLRAPPSLQLA